MRKLAFVLLILIVLAVGVMFFGFSQLNGFVETAIEQEGSALTQTEVAVDGVDIALTSGTAMITGLTIGNPQGFSEAKAFSLKGLSATLDPARVSADLVVIKELIIDEPVVVYEVGAKGSNIDFISRTLDANSGGRSDDELSGPRFIIEKLKIGKGELVFGAGASEVGSSDIPAIELEDIGEDTNGVTGSQLGEIIVDELTQETMSVVTKGTIGKVLDRAIDKIFGED